MSYVPAPLRRLVRERANDCCEYCLLHERYTIKRHEIDHIEAEKHGGTTVADNLCLSCVECNRHKGSDIASRDLETGEIVAFFHPRHDKWSEHFSLDGSRIVPHTPQGRVTIRLLQLNAPHRMLERERLINLGRYPC